MGRLQDPRSPQRYHSPRTIRDGRPHVTRKTTGWRKYGEQLSNFVDRNKESSKTNTYARQLNGVINRGTRVAVCRMASTAIAGSIARTVGGTQDEILKEIADNLLPNAQLVPARIVAVNRAQERGYTLVHAV